MKIPTWGRRLGSIMLRWPRRRKAQLQAATDLAALVTALACIGIWQTSLALAVYLPLALLASMASVFALRAAGAYRAWLRYFGSEMAVVLLGVALLLSLATTLLHRLALGLWLPLTHAVDVFVVLCVALALPRLAARWMFHTIQQADREAVVIYGAGSAGRELASALRAGNRYKVVAFLDDDARIQASSVMDVPVYAPQALNTALIPKGVQRVLLAMPQISRNRRREIISWLVDLGTVVQSVPGTHDLVQGAARIDELRDLDVQDLLGRDVVPPVRELIEHDLRARVVLVTGGGGSIGSELARQAVRHQARRLIVLDHSEIALYDIEAELHKLVISSSSPTEVICVLGNVLDAAKVDQVMTMYEVETVYHAAAYKHVPLVEANPGCGVQNNVLGTLNVARAAAAAEVESFVLISTDKAVRPTNVMGASKRLAELVIQALAKVHNRTRFSVVRFGNVLNSSGSVVPLFRRQIAEGGPVTVTHPEVIRYFMTIPEAAQLVIQAGAQGRHAEVFLLDMGEPVRIMDLAVKMVRLAGMQPVVVDAAQANSGVDVAGGQIEVRVSGLRPGEKLYEELLVTGAEGQTRHPRIRMAHEPSQSWAQVQKYLTHINENLAATGSAEMRELLLSLPLHYQPDNCGDEQRDLEKPFSIPPPLSPTPLEPSRFSRESVVTST